MIFSNGKVNILSRYQDTDQQVCTEQMMHYLFCLRAMFMAQILRGLM